MAKIKYHLVVAQGYPAVDAAASLDKKVNNLMEAGWEPSMPPGMIYCGDIYTVFQTVLSNPAHQAKVTAGGHLVPDPVTPTLGDTQVFMRDTPRWKDAWAALEEEVSDITIWMYMLSKISKDGLSWDHSFKHIETRSYKTVSTPREI